MRSGLAVNPGDPRAGGRDYAFIDFGVPGSSSDGLVGFKSCGGNVDLWDESLLPEGGPSRPRLRSRMDLAPNDGHNDYNSSFAFSSLSRQLQPEEASCSL